MFFSGLFALLANEELMARSELFVRCVEVKLSGVDL
jgi:hypothetical protein